VTYEDLVHKYLMTERKDENWRRTEVLAELKLDKGKSQYIWDFHLRCPDRLILLSVDEWAHVGHKHFYNPTKEAIRMLDTVSRVQMPTYIVRLNPNSASLAIGKQTDAVANALDQPITRALSLPLSQLKHLTVRYVGYTPTRARMLMALLEKTNQQNPKNG